MKKYEVIKDMTIGDFLSNGPTLDICYKYLEFLKELNCDILNRKSKAVWSSMFYIKDIQVYLENNEELLTWLVDTGYIRIIDEFEPFINNEDFTKLIRICKMSIKSRNSSLEFLKEFESVELK
jgi:hypothetical protein